GVDAPGDAPLDVPCGSMTCGAGDLCVKSHTTGGPCIAVLDSGLCPNGSQPVGLCCVYDFTSYACKPRPSSCQGGSLSCSCAPTLCSGGCACTSASGDTIACECAGA